jgi:phosphoribosylanthranilate isomerase
VAEVLKTAETVGLDFIQLHGMELVDQLLKYQKYRVIKAFRIGGADSIASMQAYLAEADKLGCPPYAVLVDAYVPGHVGGTGVTIVDEVLRQIPAHPRMILAGGLTPLNVVDRLRLIQPWMVDVASGVESAPGQKCPDRIQAFVDVVRSR